jgi:hypothetical protein
VTPVRWHSALHLPTSYTHLCIKERPHELDGSFMEIFVVPFICFDLVIAVWDFPFCSKFVLKVLNAERRPELVFDA